MTPAPIPGSYWLIDGELLAGEYPRDVDEKAAGKKLRKILDAGIRSFIDLTQPTDPLEPYDGLLQSIAAAQDLEVSYRRIAIRDMSVPTVELMAEILTAIESELASLRPVYFHCWGGIGRTGTVAGCWLVEQGLSCDEALARIRQLRVLTPDGWQDSPQTPAQKSFVRTWTLRRQG
jgi:protein tyrosine/serine phosphatase